MNEFTLADLRRILEASSGAVDGVEWDHGEILDMPFGDLGYDSLAVLELTAQIHREYVVKIPEDDVGELKTPRIAVDYVNRLLEEA